MSCGERLADRFFLVESLPTTLSGGPAPRARGLFRRDSCSRYRNKLKKRKAVGAEHNLTWEVAASCRGLEEEIHRLYLQVIDHSDFVFERLNQAFFTQMDGCLGSDAFFILGFRQENGVKRLVACELVICDKTTMHPLYSGFDYWLKRDSDLYFNAFYKVIEEAERRGFARVHLGQTAYEVKAELGATCTKLYFGRSPQEPDHQIPAVDRARILAAVARVSSARVFAEPPTPRKTGSKPAAVPVHSEAK